MALPTDPGQLWYVDPIPTAGDDLALRAWLAQLMERLAQFMRQPEFGAVVLSEINTALDPEFKVRNGLLVYVNAGVLGPQEGVYIYEENQWRKL